jgi:hypothetical protein
MFVLERQESAGDNLHYVKKARYENCYSDQKVILTSVFSEMTEVLTVIRMRMILWVYESFSDVGDFGPGDLIGLVASVRVMQSSMSFDMQASDIGFHFLLTGAVSRGRV